MTCRKIISFSACAVVNSGWTIVVQPGASERLEMVNIWWTPPSGVVVPSTYGNRATMIGPVGVMK